MEYRFFAVIARGMMLAEEMSAEREPSRRENVDAVRARQAGRGNYRIYIWNGGPFR